MIRKACLSIRAHMLVNSPECWVKKDKDTERERSPAPRLLDICPDAASMPALDTPFLLLPAWLSSPHREPASRKAFKLSRSQTTEARRPLNWDSLDAGSRFRGGQVQGFYLVQAFAVILHWAQVNRQVAEYEWSVGRGRKLAVPQFLRAIRS